jgi:hypothetical protein
LVALRIKPIDAYYALIIVLRKNHLCTSGKLFVDMIESYVQR